MNAPLIWFLTYTVGSVAFGCLLGAWMADCGEHAAPDGSAGDLLADQPAEIVRQPEALLFVPREWVA